MEGLAQEAFSDRNFAMQTPWELQSADIGQPITTRHYDTSKNMVLEREIRQDRVENADEQHGYKIVHKETVSHQVSQVDLTKCQRRQQTVGVKVDGYHAKIRWHTDVEEGFLPSAGSPEAQVHPNGKQILHEKWENEIFIDLLPLLQRGGNPIVRGFTAVRQDPNSSEPKSRRPKRPMTAPQPNMPTIDLTLKEEESDDEDTLFVQQDTSSRKNGRHVGSSLKNPVYIKDEGQDSEIRQLKATIHQQHEMINEILQHQQAMQMQQMQQPRQHWAPPYPPPPPQSPYPPPAGPSRSKGKSRASMNGDEPGSGGGASWGKRGS